MTLLKGESRFVVERVVAGVSSGVLGFAIAGQPRRLSPHGLCPPSAVSTGAHHWHA